MPTISSSLVIPKEQLTAWERWELGALAESATAQRDGDARAADAAARAGALEDARKQGHAEGIKAARAEIERLRAIADAATEALDALGNTLASRTAELAIAIARQVVRNELSVRPELVVTVAAEALSMLQSNDSRMQIVVHPEDAALIAERQQQLHMTAAELRITGDVSVARGGARICALAGEVDATLESRWNLVLGSLDLRDE